MTSSYMPYPDHLLNLFLRHSFQEESYLPHLLFVTVDIELRRSALFPRTVALIWGSAGQSQSEAY